MYVFVGQEINGRLTISFDMDANSLKDVAQPLMIEVLKTAGMYLDDAQQWKFDVDGRRSPRPVRCRMPACGNCWELWQSPIPAVVTASAKGQADAKEDPASASQRTTKR